MLLKNSGDLCCFKFIWCHHGALKSALRFISHTLITNSVADLFSSCDISFKKNRFSGLYIFRHIYGMQIHFSEVGAQTLNWWEQSCSHWAPPDSSHSSCFLSRSNRTLRTGYELGHSSCRCWELKLCHRRHGGKKTPPKWQQQHAATAAGSCTTKLGLLTHYYPACLSTMSLLLMLKKK